MRTGLAVLATWALLATAARAQGPDKDKLRAAAQLPISASININLVEGMGSFVQQPPHPNVSAEIGNVEKELRGDVTDAERYERLGDLYAEAKDTGRSRGAYDKAVALYRQQAADRPKDGRVLRHLANVLRDEQSDEREALLRRAVGLSPGDWECWQALQELLFQQAFEAIKGGKPGRGTVYFDQLVAPTAEGKIDRPRAERADRLLKEANDCADHAVRVAPREARVYANRASLHYSCRGIKAAVGLALGDASAAAKPPVAPNVVEDLRVAVKLDPANDGAYRFLLIAEAFNDLEGKVPERRRPGELRGSLSPATQKLLHEVLARYDAQARGPDPRAAADAAQFVGGVRLLFLWDAARAEADLRQAVRLDPTRDGAWDLLMHLFSEKGREQDLLAVVMERVKQSDIPRSRLILAQVYDWTGQMDKAQETLTLLLQKDPENAEAALGLVAAALRRADEASLVRAKAQMARAEELVNRAGRPDLHAEYGISKAIYLGLTGRPAEAQSTILDVLIQDASNKRAREVLEALGR
jgi:tetratricopeptide (TPR) repeat protein